MNTYEKWKLYYKKLILVILLPIITLLNSINSYVAWLKRLWANEWFMAPDLNLCYLEMKRNICRYFNPITILLVIAILLQSCKAYYKESVTVEEAIGHNVNRVKLITTDDRKYIFDSIYYKNEKIYGRLVKARNLQRLDVQIYPESIKEIYLYNKGKSIGLSLALILGIPLTFTAIFFIAFIFSPHEPV